MKSSFLVIVVSCLFFAPAVFGAENGIDAFEKIPEFRDLSLKITEPQLFDHIEKHQLYFEKADFEKDPKSDRLSYWLLNREGENAFVYFAAGKCVGIQRMHPVSTDEYASKIGSAEFRAWAEKRRAEPDVRANAGSRRGSP